MNSHAERPSVHGHNSAALLQDCGETRRCVQPSHCTPCNQRTEFRVVCPPRSMDPMMTGGGGHSFPPPVAVSRRRRGVDDVVRDSDPHVIVADLYGLAVQCRAQPPHIRLLS